MMWLPHWWCDCHVDDVTVPLLMWLACWWCDCPIVNVTGVLMMWLSHWGVTLLMLWLCRTEVARPTKNQLEARDLTLITDNSCPGYRMSMINLKDWRFVTVTGLFTMCNIIYSSLCWSVITMPVILFSSHLVAQSACMDLFIATLLMDMPDVKIKLWVELFSESCSVYGKLTP